MRKPSGADLMAILINLLADQEGVVIQFSVESVKADTKCEKED